MKRKALVCIGCLFFSYLPPAIVMGLICILSCAAPKPQSIQAPGPDLEKVNGAPTANADELRGRGNNLSDMGFAPRVASIEFAPIQFDLGSARIRKDQGELLAAIASDITWDAKSCTVTGYACPLGSRAYNQALGLARAKVVVRSLRAHQVRKGFVMLSFGEDSLVASAPAEYWRNRRVIVECVK